MKRYNAISNSMFKLSIILIISFANAYSATNWFVRPMIFSLNSERGDTLTRIFNLYNGADKPVELKIYMRDILYNEQGNGAEKEPGIVERGLAKWTEFSPKLVNLGPSGSRQVRFTIIFPGRIEPGYYWTNIYVEAFKKPELIAQQRAGEKNFSVLALIRYKVQIKATIAGDNIKNGEITNVEIVSDTTNRNLNIYTTIENKGNLLLGCKGKVDLRDDFGETVETISLRKFSVYPDCKRIIKTEIPQGLKTGEYSALVIIDYGGEYLVAGEAFFEIPSENK